MKTALIILTVLLGVLIILLLLICGFTFNQIIWYKQIPLPKFIGRLIAGNESAQSDYDRDRDAAIKAFADFPIEKLSLTASNGEILRGSVITPPNTNGKLLIACHGAHSSGIGEFCFAMPYFYREGYTVLMPEHRGCGESDGKFLGYGTHESKDTLLWLEYARKRFPELNIYLYGVSMGGATVLMMSDKINDPAVKGVIADCSYTSAWDEFSYQLKTSFHLPNFPMLHTCNLICRLICGYDFRDASPVKAVSNSSLPVLFIHGAADDFVPQFMQDELYAVCPTRKEKLTVDGAVHARSYYTDPAAYESAMESFIAECEKSEAV
ncbi:MAG: alpha/beta hydrolase [Oscillospiraceae bacterium]|nr:alpha/beta hydrolase [Oscillospiraceae bacterium]